MRAELLLNNFKVYSSGDLASFFFYLLESEQNVRNGQNQRSYPEYPARRKDEGRFSSYDFRSTDLKNN